MLWWRHVRAGAVKFPKSWLGTLPLRQKIHHFFFSHTWITRFKYLPDGCPYILMYSALHIMQWFSHILDVFTPNFRQKFSILTFLWIKTNFAYTRLEVIAKQRSALQVEFMGCFTIRVHFQNLHSSHVLTVEAYFDFKVLLPRHWSGLDLPTAIKRRLESINFSKKYAHSEWFCWNLPSHLGFFQILCSSITWNKRKESLFVNSEEIIWTRPFYNLKAGKNLWTINTLIKSLANGWYFPSKNVLSEKSFINQ